MNRARTGRDVKPANIIRAAARGTDSKAAAGDTVDSAAFATASSDHTGPSLVFATEKSDSTAPSGGGEPRPAAVAREAGGSAAGQYAIKLIDFGTAVGLKEAQAQSKAEASASLMTFTELEFAG